MPRINPKDLPPQYREQVEEQTRTQGFVKAFNAPIVKTDGVIVARLEPMGKPRMPRRDKWAKRDCVVRYHAFADELRRQVQHLLPPDVAELSWTAYFTMPESWSQKKKAQHAGQPHRAKPDRDNIDKAILDALFEQDSGIATGTLCKRWDDGLGARIVIVAKSFSG